MKSGEYLILALNDNNKGNTFRKIAFSHFPSLPFGKKDGSGAIQEQRLFRHMVVGECGEEGLSPRMCARLLQEGWLSYSI